MPPRRTLVASAVLALFLAFSTAAHADALGDLEKAHSAYVAHKYEDAERRLRALLARSDDLKDPDNVAEARMYLGAVLAAQGRKSEANAVFEQLLIEKPDYQPDPLRVSLDAINVLIDARTRLREKLAALQAERVRQAQEERAHLDAERQKASLHLAMLEKLASEERVVERNTRWRALLPFGAGQFQNQQDALGWAFVASESLLLVGAAVSVVVSYYDQLQANDAVERSEQSIASQYEARARAAWIAAGAFDGGFLLTAIAGAVHAELTFVPEQVTVRRRLLPPVSLRPVIGPSGIGIAGRF